MMNIFKYIFAHNRKRQPIMTILDLPLLLRGKLDEDLKPENIVGYHYKVEYETTDWVFPIDPEEALPFLTDFCKREQPNVIVGTSMGGMYAQQMPIDVRYDDGGYGVPPEPHRINHFWPLPQGEVYMKWHGLDDFSWYNGLDHVRIELWDDSRLRECRDEAYWRSEVD